MKRWGRIRSVWWAKTHDFHVIGGPFGITAGRKKNTDNIAKSIAHLVVLKTRALFVQSISLTVLPRQPLITPDRYSRRLMYAGARWIVLCDTNAAPCQPRSGASTRARSRPQAFRDRLGIPHH